MSRIIKHSTWINYDHVKLIMNDENEESWLCAGAFSGGVCVQTASTALVSVRKPPTHATWYRLEPSRIIIYFLFYTRTIGLANYRCRTMDGALSFRSYEGSNSVIYSVKVSTGIAE